ncbi:MAG: hypothetical protein CL785_02350 [Chloroflexi bacterium]|nr:hypothetical protein [Chloroflexota bacterium]|tara:strand:- start:16993 stop:17706 length:714 start_codon:yes stop_codon:yes gene_type:complete
MSETTQKQRMSSVTENYLLSLYILREQNERATQVHLADYIRKLPPEEGLGSSLPSVTAMLKRMEKDNLVVVEGKKTVRFTPAGLKAAETMIRRHRLASCMVVEMLDMPLERAYIEAHRLEHAISNELERHINNKLNNPAKCPFGRPIPGNHQTISSKGLFKLSEVATGTHVQIERIPPEDQSLLEFLISKNILPKQICTVAEAGKYRGVLVLKISNEDVSLGYQAAEQILVERIDTE